MGASFRFLLGAHAFSTARHDFDVCWIYRICVLLQNAPPIVMTVFGMLRSCEYSQFTNTVPSLACGNAIAWFIELCQYCCSDATVLLACITSELIHSFLFIVSNCCEENYISICHLWAYAIFSFMVLCLAHSSVHMGGEVGHITRFADVCRVKNLLCFLHHTNNVLVLGASPWTKPLKCRQVLW